jgi:probable F420-dependent oxidoreductase
VLGGVDADQIQSPTLRDEKSKAHDRDSSDNPGRYRKPLAATASFLDELDATSQPVPVQRRVLAALGPKMLQLSARRSDAAHPYLVTPEHTATARGVLGDGPLLLPEQTVILTDSADEARAIGTDWLHSYLGYRTMPTTCFARDSRKRISVR